MENVNPAREKILKLIDLINNEKYSKASHLSSQLLAKNKRSHIIHNLHGVVNLHMSKYDEAILEANRQMKTVGRIKDDSIAQYGGPLI